MLYEDRRAADGEQLGFVLHLGDFIYEVVSDPGKTKTIDRMAALERLGEIETLVEIDHELHVGADALARRSDRGDVVSEPVAAHPELQRFEAALGAQLWRLDRKCSRRPQP